MYQRIHFYTANTKSLRWTDYAFSYIINSQTVFSLNSDTNPMSENLHPKTSESRNVCRVCIQSAYGPGFHEKRRKMSRCISHCQICQSNTCYKHQTLYAVTAMIKLQVRNYFSYCGIW